MKFKEYLEIREGLTNFEKQLDILEEQMAMPGGSPLGTMGKSGPAMSKSLSTVMDDLKRMFSKVTTTSGIKGVYNTVIKRFNDLINRAKTPGEIAQLAKQKVDVSKSVADTQKSGGM